MTVGLSTTAIFSVFAGYNFFGNGNFIDETSVIYMVQKREQ